MGKDRELNELLVVRGTDHPALYSHDLIARELNWFAGTPPAQTFECTAKTRYRQNDQPCVVSVLADDKVKVDFKIPQRAMTPGQYVVFYSNEICLGGGVIESVGPSLHTLGESIHFLANSSSIEV